MSVDLIPAGPYIVKVPLLFYLISPPRKCLYAVQMCAIYLLSFLNTQWCVHVYVSECEKGEKGLPVAQDSGGALCLSGWGLVGKLNPSLFISVFDFFPLSQEHFVSLPLV